MNEQEWLACDDPHLMMAQLTDRGRQFFACLCVRSIWHLLPDERSKKALELTEAFLLGKARKEEVATAGRAALAAVVPAAAYVAAGPYGTVASTAGAYAAADAAAAAAGPYDIAASTAGAYAATAAHTSIYTAAYAAAAHAAHAAAASAIAVSVDEFYSHATQREKQAQFVREVANPYAMPFTHPHAAQFAHAIRDDNLWHELPVLGDLLTDLACPEQRMIAHCYQPTHHLGCWVVEALVQSPG